MIAAILAASFTFTATATGVAKGTPLEFVFAGKDSDRDYETMFLLEEPVDEFCRRIESAGIPRGRPTDASACRLWPVGCALEFSPPLDSFISSSLPGGMKSSPPVYTGGTRNEKGVPVAANEMPSAVFSLYTLSQSPVVHDGIFDQGIVYGAHLAAKELKKGDRIQFTVKWNLDSMPKHIDVHVTETNAAAVLSSIRKASESGAVDVTISFDSSLTVSAATAAASALSMLDSARIKLNGLANGNLFYRAFLPDISWTNRTSRLVQPFELTLLENSDRLVFVSEDWNVDGDDPKLTLNDISFSDAHKQKIDTCFVFATGDCRLSRIFSAMEKLKGARISKWYVFTAPYP